MIEKLIIKLDNWLQGIIDRIAENRSKKLRQMIDELKMIEEQKNSIRHQHVVSAKWPEVSHLYEKPWTKKILTEDDYITCKHCGQKFYRKRINQVFCKHQCCIDYWKIHADVKKYPSNSKEAKHNYYIKNREVILLKRKLRYVQKQKEKQYAKERAIANQSNTTTPTK